MQNSEIIFTLQSHDDQISENSERITKLEDIVKGDGAKAGLAPMTLSHEEELHGDKGVLSRLTSLETNAIRTAAWVAGAVFVATIVAQIAMLFVGKLIK